MSNTGHQPNPNKPHLSIHKYQLPDGTYQRALRINNTGIFCINRAMVRELLRIERAWGWWA